MKKLLIVLWILSLIFSFYCYQVFPDTIATHYDWQLQPDCFGDKISVFSYPLILIGISLMLLLLSRFDPFKKQFFEFERTYWRVLKILAVFALAMQVVEFLNVSYGMQGNGLALVIGLMLMVLGNYLPKVKYNYFIGIRTPWTYCSELNWYKTHRLGGCCFMLAGLAFLLYALWQEGLLLWMASGMVLFPLIYSFLFYLKELKQNARN